MKYFVRTPRFFLLAALVCAAPAQAQDRLVVLNAADGEAVLVDPVSHQVLARMPTGLQPREVAMSPDGRLAYIANYGGDGPQQRGTITVLDLAGRRVAATFRPEGYASLHDIHVGSRGRRMWLTAEADSGIVEMDTQTGTVLMFWKTGGAKSHTLVTSPDSRQLYVANAHSDSVTIIDRLTTVPTRVPTGSQPEGLDVSPNGKELWVANRGDNTLTIISPRKLKVLETIESGGVQPHRVTFRPDGTEVWVSNWGTQTVSIFGAKDRAMIGQVELEAGPKAILFSPDGLRAFVSAPDRDVVFVIDVDTREVLAEFRPGDAPHGMAWSAPDR